MSWDNQGGGGPWGNNGGSGGPGSPWGRGSGNQGGGQTPPDIDEVIRRGQAKLKSLLPKGFGGWKAGILVVIVLWEYGQLMVSTEFNRTKKECQSF